MANGSAYAFARDVNCEWKHGVIAEEEGWTEPGTCIYVYVYIYVCVYICMSVHCVLNMCMFMCM